MATPDTDERPIKLDQLPSEVQALIRMRENSGGGRGSWSTWSEHVLAELDRLNGNYERLQSDTSTKLTEIAIEMQALKVKSGLWGIAGALSTILIAILIFVITETAGNRMKAAAEATKPQISDVERFVEIPGRTNEYMLIRGR